MRDISCATVDPPGGDSRTKSWTRKDYVALAVVTAIGGLLRAIAISDPTKQVFDEPFYARDACRYLDLQESVCEIGREMNLEHPPLGKWLIAAGEAVFGYTPLGWRVASLVAGVVAIALTYVLARKLLHSTMAATFAAGLLAIDFLHFVNSRLAMLDVFLGLFVLVAFTAAAFDRDALLAGRIGVLARPWRLVAGAAAGAATATKFSGLFALVGVLAVEIAWEVWQRKPAPRVKAFGSFIARDGMGVFIAFLLLPALVYVAAYAGRVSGDLIAVPWSEGSWFNALFERHRDAFRFHRDNNVTNPYSSPPWTWLLLKRAFPYHFEVTDDGLYRQLLAGGSPLVWWLSIPALAATTIAWFQNNRPTRPEGLVLAGFYWNFLPWVAFAAAPFLIGSARTAVFIFYVVPLLPFMFIAMAGWAQRACRYAWGRVAVGIFGMAAVGLFWFYWPFLTDRPLERDAWRARIAMFNDCGRDAAPIVVYDIRTVDGTPTTKRVEQGRQFLPPQGWCWVQVRQGISKVNLQQFLTPSPPP